MIVGAAAVLTSTPALIGSASLTGPLDRLNVQSVNVVTGEHPSVIRYRDDKPQRYRATLIPPVPNCTQLNALGGRARLAATWLKRAPEPGDKWFLKEDFEP